MKLDYGWKESSDFKRWGPYLSFGKHASSEMCISWQSKFFSMKHWIDYGETEDCGTKIEEKIEPTTMHVFYLIDLKPNTKYYYKISRSEDLHEKIQPIYSFQTGPEEGKPTKFEFNLMADAHVSKGSSVNTLNSMIKNAPNANFLLSCGDAVTHGGEEERWNDFFHMFKPVISCLPIMHTTGNHDTDHQETYAHFVQTFHHPYVNRDNGGYYVFIYGNAVFIMLDSTNAGQSSAMQGVISDDQMDWLEGVLEEYALKNYWIFIFMHHQMYSMGDSGMMNLYELAYRDLFDEYHVDGVFYGHDHHFELHWAARDAEWGGTHYGLVGHSGGNINLNDLMDPKREPTLSNYFFKRRSYVYERDGILDGNMDGIRNDEFIKKSHVYSIIEPGFSNLSINGDECELKVWGWQNQIYFKDVFKRTDTGKKYHKPKFILNYIE